jgi:hypothetical protein
VRINNSPMLKIRSNVLFVSRFARKLKPAISKLHYWPDSAALS